MISKKDYKMLVEEHFPAICKFYALMVCKNGEGVWKSEYKARMNEHNAVLRDCEIAKDSKTRLILKFCEENGYESAEGIASALSEVFSASGISREESLVLCGSLINNMSAIVGKIDIKK